MGRNFQLPLVDELELRAKVRRCLVHALAASQRPHWSPQGCPTSRGSSNGRGKIVCLSSGFVAAIPPLSCFQNLGFLLERHVTQERDLCKSSGSQTGQQRSRERGGQGFIEQFAYVNLAFYTAIPTSKT